MDGTCFKILKGLEVTVSDFVDYICVRSRRSGRG